MSETIEILTSYYGQPEHQFNFNENSGILFFPALPDEELFESTWVTYGLLNLIPHKQASELILNIQGDFDTEQVEKIAKEFFNAIIELAKENVSIEPNELIQHFALPSVNNTASAYITSTDPTQINFFDENESLRQLRIYPIHSGEYELLKKVNFEYRSKLFFTLPTNWFELNRAEINIYEVLFASVWKRIINWYNENSPSLLNKLGNQASPEIIASVEKRIGFNVPDDLKISLMIHNGGLIMHQYTLLSIQEIEEKIHQMVSSQKEKPFVSIESNFRWQANTVPFAEDEKGDLICYLPNQTEPELSVFFYDIRNGKTSADNFSFAHWLSNYADALERGAYKVDENGKLI